MPQQQRRMGRCFAAPIPRRLDGRGSGSVRHSVADERCRYRAQACGAPMTDGLWEGGSSLCRSTAGRRAIASRNNTAQFQEHRWASGLTAIISRERSGVRSTRRPACPAAAEPLLRRAGSEVESPTSGWGGGCSRSVLGLREGMLLRKNRRVVAVAPREISAHARLRRTARRPEPAFGIPADIIVEGVRPDA